MMVLTKALIRESEENAVKSGAFSFRDLMLKAGNSATEIILERIDIKNKRIAVLCGNGNNGGDGFVIARKLYEYGASVKVVLPLGLPKTEDAKHYFSLLSDIEITEFTDDYDIIIDAVFGIGLNRDISDELSELFSKINKSSAYKISVDIPSGIEADSGKILNNAISSDFTITFIALKPCFLVPQGSDYCGEVIVCDIGVEPIGYKYSTTEKPIFKKRNKNCHKGTFGTALLICGSYGMAGAAMLSAKAAMRSGLGIAKCAIPDSIYGAFTSYIPEAVCLPYKNLSDLDFENALSGCKAVLIGCGLGNKKKTLEFLEKLLNFSNVPIVIDADGINALSSNIELLRKSKAPVILTPHPAEMARLNNSSVSSVEENRIKTANDFAKEYNCFVILKGANTIIASPDREIRFNIGGNPGMATAGSGDVLAGVIVSLLAQGFSPFDAANFGVFLHSEAGDKAFIKKGERAMIASDIIEEL